MLIRRLSLEFASQGYHHIFYLVSNEPLTLMQYVDNHCRNHVKNLFLMDFKGTQSINLFIFSIKYDQVSPLLYNAFHYDKYTISTA